MKLIITDSISKTEFHPLEKIFNLEMVKIAARKSLSGLADNIKNSVKMPGTILNKVYLTSSSGAGRSVFLIRIDEQNSFLVIMKTKKDKSIGENMTIKNTEFKKLLEKNLSLIINDIGKGHYSEYEI